MVCRNSFKYFYDPWRFLSKGITQPKYLFGQEAQWRQVHRSAAIENPFKESYNSLLGAETALWDTKTVPYRDTEDVLQDTNELKHSLLGTYDQVAKETSVVQCAKSSAQRFVKAMPSLNTVNPLLSPPGGLFFSSAFDGGLNREGGLKREGGLI